MTLERPWREPPHSEAELMQNAGGLAGLTLAQLAGRLGVPLPSHPDRAKGWTGALVEKYLGASAASLPEPDFQAIGVELKTLPVNRHGKPAESTYVCTVPVRDVTGMRWESSTVRKKLARVLWVPVESDSVVDFSRRRIGSPFLWSPDPGQEHDLRTDWEEIIELISLGRLEEITSALGNVLQVRPKGMNSAALTPTVDAGGEAGMTLPRGFYLRTSFTRQVLQASH